MVPMTNIVRLTEEVAPKELNHFNKLRSATLTATIAPGYTLGDALAYLEDAAQQVLPATAQIDYAGQSREFKESASSLYFTFVLALAFIYLVLAAQFESFIDPLIIMLTVPLSITGALIALHLTGNTLNVYSQIGLITLIGLITKHGILLVEFSNKLQEQGRTKVEAVIEAAAPAPAPDPDDHRRDGAGRGPARDRERCRRREPLADRLGDRRRHLVRHPVHPVRGADRLHAAGAHAQPRR